MKKTIIILIVLIIFMLSAFIVVINYPEPKEYKYNNTYTKTTINYIDNKKYSTREETITLINSAMNYSSTITYEDESIEPITIEIINKYEEKEDNIITKTKTYYINKKQLCLETIDCASPYSVKPIIVENNINKKQKYEVVKKITPSKEGVELYFIVDKLTKDKKTLLNNITNDFNIKIKVIELNKKNKKELEEKYKIKESNTYILFLNGTQSYQSNNLNTHQEIATYLFLRGIDYR